MEPIAFQAAVLRAQAPELVLRLGQTVVARVLAAQNGHGHITLAGATLAARLPEDVPEGATLRLRVEEVGAERILLRALDPQNAGIALPVPAGQARLWVELESEDAERGAPREDGTERVALAFETPELGRLGLRLERSARGGVRVRVEAGAGPPFASAQAGAEELERAVAAATNELASVTVTERRDPLDLYA